MLCCADTIVRIKYVKQSEKDKLVIVWAIGNYPIGSEDREIELILFLPVDSEERDLDIHAVFEKDKYFCIGGKIVPEIHENKLRPKMVVSTSTHVKILKADLMNRCPLKVSLVGTAKKISNEFGNNENAVIDVLVTDYVCREYKFTVKVAFPHLSPQFKSLAGIIRPRETVIFIVGQMEIIDRELYVYAHDINCIDIHPFKENEHEIISEQTSIKLAKSTRSKLTNIHQSMSKYVNIELNETIKDTLEEGLDEDATDNFVRNYEENEVEKQKKGNKRSKGNMSSSKKSKRWVAQEVIHNTRQSSRSGVIVVDEEEE